jgi:hypothetical protein
MVQCSASARDRTGLDENLPFISSAKEIIDRGQIAVEVHVDDAASNRQDGAVIP